MKEEYVMNLKFIRRDLNEGSRKYRITINYSEMRGTSSIDICIVTLSFNLSIKIIQIQNVFSLEGKVEEKVPKGALIWGLKFQRVRIPPNSL